MTAMMSKCQRCGQPCHRAQRFCGAACSQLWEMHDYGAATYSCVHCGGLAAVRSCNSICTPCAKEETGD